MAAKTQHVTLKDLLQVQSSAVPEISGWALLLQSTITLLESTKDGHGQSSWLISPDTMLLYHSGVVKFCPGIPAANEQSASSFTAPELYGVKEFQSIAELEKTYVYSLGMTIYYALQEYPANDDQGSYDELEAVLNKMTSEAADERISLHLVLQECKCYQDKNPLVVLSDEVSHMVELVLGGQLEFSYDHLDLDDESLERELLHAANMRTSSERLSSCGTTESTQSLTSKGSQQALLSSTGSFRKTAGHHSNLSIKSLGSSVGASHEWSAGLAPTLPPPSQRWSSYDCVHIDQQTPPPLNMAALSFESERRQLPLSPTGTTSSEDRANADTKSKKKSSRPKSADVSNYHERVISAPHDHQSLQSKSHDGPSNNIGSHEPQSHDIGSHEPQYPGNGSHALSHGSGPHEAHQSLQSRSHDDQSNDIVSHEPSNNDLQEALELPQLQPAVTKKMVLSLDTPPSPVSISRMSPKVAASLEKINQLLANSSPSSNIPDLETGDIVTTGSDNLSEPANFAKHKFAPSPLLTGPDPSVNGIQSVTSSIISQQCLPQESVANMISSPDKKQVSNDDSCDTDVLEEQPPPIPAIPPPIPATPPPNEVTSAEHNAIGSEAVKALVTDRGCTLEHDDSQQQEVLKDLSIEEQQLSLLDDTSRSSPEVTTVLMHTENADNSPLKEHKGEILQCDILEQAQHSKFEQGECEAPEQQEDLPQPDTQLEQHVHTLQQDEHDGLHRLQNDMQLATEQEAQEGLKEESQQELISEKSVASEYSQVVFNDEEEPGYVTIADTKKRIVSIHQGVTPYAVTEICRTHSEHQLDKSEMFHPLTKRVRSVDNSLQVTSNTGVNSVAISHGHTERVRHLVKDVDPSIAVKVGWNDKQVTSNGKPVTELSQALSDDGAGSIHGNNDRADYSLHETVPADVNALYAKVNKTTMPQASSDDHIRVVADIDNADRGDDPSDVNALYAKVNKTTVPQASSDDPIKVPSDINALYAKVNKEKQKIAVEESASILPAPPNEEADDSYDTVCDFVTEAQTVHPTSSRPHVTFMQDCDIVHTRSEHSDEVKLRHTPVQTGTSSLMIKSNSTQDLTDTGVQVYDPRRHSALPAASHDYSSDTVYAVPDSSPTNLTQRAEKFEPTYDEDWRKVSSVGKLQEVFGPEFSSLSGGMWKKSVSFVATPVTSNMPSGNRRTVEVVLLNDKKYSVVVEVSSKCQEVFNQVVSYLSLGEPHVFGLSVVKGDEDYFLDLNKRLVKYAPAGWLDKNVYSTSLKNPHKAPPIFTVYFRIRFFVENIHELRMVQTRHQYYLQMRRDIQLGKMYCHEETALLLASYALQIEKGDYGPTLEGKEYYRLEEYVPEKAINQLSKDYINSILPHMHSDLRGLSKETAERQFLQETQKLTEYGQVFYRLYKERNKPHSVVVIGFCVRGIILYNLNKDTKIPTQKLSWKQIENIVFKQRRFELHISGSDKPLVYYTSSAKKALYLFGLAKSYHYFQMKCREAPVNRYSLDQNSTTLKLDTIVTKSHSVQSRDEEVIKLLKKPGTGLGFKIMGGKKKERRDGIFVKSITKDSPADIDGRMKPFDQIIAVNGQSVAGYDHKEVGQMVQESPPLIQITVIHHHHAEEEHLLEMSYNKHSPLSPEPDDRPTLITTPNYDDDTKYRTVLIRKDNDQLGFSVKGSVRGVYISNLEPGTAIARKKLLQIGTVIVAVNGVSVEGQTVHEVLQLLLQSDYQLELTVQLSAQHEMVDERTSIEGDQFVVEIDRGDEEDLGLLIAKRRDGFFFVKSLIPGSPADCCNKLLENDIIIQVNDKRLNDCTNAEARQVLYTVGQFVSLCVCRSVITMPVLSNSPSFVNYGGIATPIHSSHTNVQNSDDGPATDDNIRVTYEEVQLNISLTKGEMSFGFKIDKHLSGQDGRGVFIDDVDDEPALSDGRLLKGDEIIKVNDSVLIDQPHQVAVFALRQIRSFGKADIMIRRRLKVEECAVSFDKSEESTPVGLIIGERPRFYDQQVRCVQVLHIQPDSLTDGLLHVGDVIVQINDTKITNSADEALKVLCETIGVLTLHIIRYLASAVTRQQPMTIIPASSIAPVVLGEGVTTIQATPPTPDVTTIQATPPTSEGTPPLAVATPQITLNLTDLVQSETIERANTPPPPASSPPPLSPLKDDGSCDHAEEWTEPQVNKKSNYDNNDGVSCSSLDTDQLSDVDHILEEIDQSAAFNSSQLSDVVAKGINDSLGTLSNLSEDVTEPTAYDLTASHNSACPPPLPLSPPPDL